MQTPEPGRLTWRPVRLPPELAAMIRPDLPALTDMIFEEIRRRVPEYAEPVDSPFGQVLRAGVELLLTTFTDLMEDPDAPVDTLADACRRFGQWEARERGTLGPLTIAHRIGVRMAWQHAHRMGYHDGVSSRVISQLADAAFGYLDMLAALCREGYLEEKARSVPEGARWRGRLLALIMERPPVPRRAIEELATVAGWTLPDAVTMVAMAPGPPWMPALADPDVLASRGDLQPHLLVPGPLDPRRRAAIAAALGGRPAAAGLTVPLAGAPDSLRWARQALALADAGIINDDPVTLCEDHLVALWLLADEALIDRIAGRQFSELMADAGGQQWLPETLAAWLETRGNTTQIAERLGVHPQTVRYRIHKLEAALGDRLDDPEARFAMAVVLRANRLRQRSFPFEDGPRATTGSDHGAIAQRITDPT